MSWFIQCDIFVLTFSLFFYFETVTIYLSSHLYTKMLNVIRFHTIFHLRTVLLRRRQERKPRIGSNIIVIWKEQNWTTIQKGRKRGKNSILLNLHFHSSLIKAIHLGPTQPNSWKTLTFSPFIFYGWLRRSFSLVFFKNILLRCVRRSLLLHEWWSWINGSAVIYIKITIYICSISGLSTTVFPVSYE